MGFERLQHGTRSAPYYRGLGDQERPLLKLNKANQKDWNCERIEVRLSGGTDTIFCLVKTEEGRCVFPKIKELRSFDWSKNNEKWKIVELVEETDLGKEGLSKSAAA